MDRLFAVALLIGSALAIADGRHTGRLTIVVIVALVVAIVGTGLRRRVTDTEADPSMSFIAEQPPERPSVATHDITELATTIGRGRRGDLPTEIAERIRMIARHRLDDPDLRSGDTSIALSPTLTDVLDGADVRAEQLDALLTELEAL